MRGKLIYLFLLISLTANSQDSLFVDCYGTDASGVVGWVGDGWCDDGAYTFGGNPIFFNCPEFNFDGGDGLPIIAIVVYPSYYVISSMLIIASADVPALDLTFILSPGISTTF